MSEAKRLTNIDFTRGYTPMGCGCHAYVFRAETAKAIPLDQVETCKKTGLVGVKIEWFEKGKK